MDLFFYRMHVNYVYTSSLSLHSLYGAFVEVLTSRVLCGYSDATTEDIGGHAVMLLYFR